VQPWRWLPLLLLGLGAALPSAAAAPRETTAPTPEGRPRVVLDHLGFPDSVSNGAYYERQLQEILRREARRAIWGAGRENTITYRFFVTQLAIELRGDVVHVRCQATGQLPRGKTAKATLTFSGAAKERDAVVVHVLEIVARGVIARLSELERTRRGQPD
jgi:hypothetical protein